MAKIYNSGSFASIIIFVDNNLAVSSFARGQVRAGEAGGNLQLYDLSSGIEPRTFFNGAASTLTNFSGTPYGATPSDVINNASFADVIGTNSGGGGASGVPNTRQINTNSPLIGGGDLSADRIIQLSTTGVPTQAPVGTELILFESGGVWRKNTLQNIVSLADEVEFYANLGLFPAVGVIDILYIDKTNLIAYLWNGAAYVSVGGGSNTVLQNGNSFASLMIIGTNNNFNLIFETNNVNRVQVETDGTLSVLTANYETLVTNPNDIPNKKYVDDRSWTRQIVAAANTTTNINLSLGNVINVTMGALTANTSLVLTNPTDLREYKFWFTGNTNRNVTFPASFIWEDGLAFDDFSSSSPSCLVLCSYDLPSLRYIVKR